MKIRSNKHKAIQGHVNGQPYHVFFNEDGVADVEEAVGEQLLRLSACEKVVESKEPFAERTVAALRQELDEKGITLPKKATKQEIIEALHQAKEEEGDEA